MICSRVSFRGPYLWFHFISRSLAQQTAKLVVDYDSFALPLSRAATAEPKEIRRYVRWLARRLGQPADRVELPPDFRRRLDVHETLQVLCDELCRTLEGRRLHHHTRACGNNLQVHVAPVEVPGSSHQHPEQLRPSARAVN